jgi:hypothetical protein
MNKFYGVIVCFLISISGCASASQSCGIFRGEYFYKAHTADADIEVLLKINAKTLSFSAGLSDGAAPVAADNVKFRCNEGGGIDFLFVDERGNHGSGMIKRVGDELVFRLTPENVDRSNLFSAQILRGYGSYNLTPVR